MEEGARKGGCNFKLTLLEPGHLSKIHRKFLGSECSHYLRRPPRAPRGSYNAEEENGAQKAKV